MSVTQKMLEYYQARSDKLFAENAALRAALEECVYFADNSQGIVGWHLNGDILPWNQVEAIDKARAALDVARKET